MIKKRLIKSVTVIAVILSLTACGKANLATDNGSATASQSQTTGNSITAIAEYTSIINPDEEFSARDKEIGYSESEAATIDLSKENSGTVTINKEGTYILTGSYSGQIIVEASDSEKIQLVLRDVTLSNTGDAAINVKSADKVFVTLEGENTINVTGDFNTSEENNVDGAVFSKSNIVFNGNGTLNVNCETENGIVGKDDVKFTSGTYNIEAGNDGIQGKDSVRIAAGTFNITAGSDGIQSSNDEKETKGYVYILEGTFNIVCGGGSDKASMKQGEQGFGGFRGNPSQQQQNTTASTEEASAKAIKAATEILICGGTFNIDSKDDALHCNGNLCIENGAYSLQTGDDGIHADDTIVINAGSLDITKSYEGIEGKVIDINGGTINVVSSDDGLNATDGSSTSQGGMGMFAATEGVELNINGGTMVISASGDGIDSNGNLTVTGGNVTVYGPESSGDSALDYDGTATITGGTVIAIGYSGMAQGFGDASTQGAILYNMSANAEKDTQIILKDSSGNVIASATSPKTYNSVVISTPGIESGKTYTLTTAGTDTQITMDSLIYSNGGNMNGGMQGGRPDKNSRNDQSNGMQRPDGMQQPNGGQAPDGMQQPNDGQAPDGMQQPNGGQAPDGMQQPNGGQAPNGMQLPDGTQNSPTQSGNSL